MKNNYKILFLGFLLTLSLQAALTNPVSQGTLMPSKNSWDLDLDLGISLKREDSLVFSRMRIGNLWMQDTTVMSLGIDLGKFSDFGFGGGIEGEWLNISSGLWVQGKVLSTQNEILLTGIGLGWSLVGIEGLMAPFNSNKAAVLAKVRFPLGLLTQ